MKKIIAALLAVALLLTACVPASPAPGQEREPEEEGPLVYWSCWEERAPQARILRELLDTFRAETGLEVQVRWVGEGLGELLPQALAQGENIDLFDWEYETVAREYGPWLTDLESMARETDYDSYAIAALAGSVRRWAGTLVCIPYQPYMTAVLYNKDLFEAAGIRETPGTWEEFLALCGRLREEGTVPLALDRESAGCLLSYELCRYLGREEAGQVLASGSWEEYPGALRALEDLEELYTLGYVLRPGPETAPEARNQVALGQAAMVVGSSLLPCLAEQEARWGMFSYPALEGGRDPAQVAHLGALAFAIPRRSRHREEAFRLITALTSGPGDQTLALETGAIPADCRNTRWSPLTGDCRELFYDLVNIYRPTISPAARKALGETGLMLLQGETTAAALLEETGERKNQNE